MEYFFFIKFIYEIRDSRKKSMIIH